MSNNSISIYTRDTLREYLEGIYGCKWIGQCIAAPYADQDEVPDQFKPPKGSAFNVPQPTAAEGKYYQWVIDDVINDNKLEVVKAAYVVSDKKKDVGNE